MPTREAMRDRTTKDDSLISSSESRPITDKGLKERSSRLKELRNFGCRKDEVKWNSKKPLTRLHASKRSK